MSCAVARPAGGCAVVGGGGRELFAAHAHPSPLPPYIRFAGSDGVYQLLKVAT